MVISWIWAGLAGGLLASTLYYRKKWKDLQGEYDKRCEELTNVLGEVGRDKILIESMQESNADLVERIGEYKHLMTSGCRIMQLKIGDGPIVLNDRSVGTVAVVGTDAFNSDYYFFVKTFTYDYYDPSDREFAIREAEELIETIQKA